MNEREKTIRLWFDMWLNQQDMGIDDIFTEDVIYTESWSPQYNNRKISIQITLQNDSMTLNIEDDGAGYPLSLVQNGPNPFETTSSNSSHFGMGLYSSRILCEKHGGRLILENRAGGGASATAIFHFV